MNTAHRTSYLFSIIVLLWILGAFPGCVATSNQVLRYETPLISYNNFIPGIEPEESARKIVIRVVGKGIEPPDGSPVQKKLMAERAAVVDGYRQLAERLAGMIIESESSVGRSSLSMDKVMMKANAYLRGAQIGAINYQAGYATADVKLYLEPRESRFYWGAVANGFCRN